MADLMLEVLQGIRAEMGALRADINARVGRLEECVEDLGKRQTATEVRLATEIVAVVDAIHQLRDVLVADRAVRDQVRDHEVRLIRLETRAG